MGLLKKEDLNKKIKKEFQYTFSVEKSGIYAVVVSARAKSWLQNLKKFISFFNDDNLAVRVNNVGFPKLSGERGEFDGEASWNGNILKGLSQIHLFILNLKEGEQNINFVAKGEPFLEFIEIFRVDKNLISIDPSKYDIEDGNRRPWFNVLTGNVGIITIKAIASANLSPNQDDNDLQIRVNGIREQNNDPKAHQYWFWCGRILRGQSKIFIRIINLKLGFNYIEFWADRKPLFNELNVRVTISDRIPTVDDPLWTGDFYDDSEEMILARLIFGEARSQSEEAWIWVASSVFNRISSPTSDWWPDTVHDVILQEQQYESFNQDNDNLPHIKNPHLDPTQKESWEDCYKIAETISKGQIKTILEVTHFHSYTNPEDIKRFETKIVPNAKFLKKIDKMYFYSSPN